MEDENYSQVEILVRQTGLAVIAWSHATHALEHCLNLFLGNEYPPTPAVRNCLHSLGDRMKIDMFRMLYHDYHGEWNFKHLLGTLEKGLEARNKIAHRFYAAADENHIETVVYSRKPEPSVELGIIDGEKFNDDLRKVRNAVKEIHKFLKSTNYLPKEISDRWE